MEVGGAKWSSDVWVTDISMAKWSLNLLVNIGKAKWSLNLSMDRCLGDRHKHGQMVIEFVRMEMEMEMEMKMEMEMEIEVVTTLVDVVSGFPGG